MKNAYSLSICICSLGVFLYSSSAYSSFSYTDLVNQIKPNLATESKPASSFTRLAMVRFVGNSDSSIKFNGTQNNIKNCPSGTTWYEGSCQKNCDKTLYPFTKKPDTNKGSFRYTVCLGQLRYGYQACNDGWLLNGGNCDVNPCSGYNFTSFDGSAGKVDLCKSGETVKYKYTSCNFGWHMENGYCYANTCGGFPSVSPVISNCAATDKCKKGASYAYQCTVCNSGYEVSNGVCTETICPTGKVNLYVCPMWKCLVPAN